MAGQRVGRHHGDHAADLQISIDGMSYLYGQRTGDHLVMQRLIAQLRIIDLLGEVTGPLMNDAQ